MEYDLEEQPKRYLRRRANYCWVFTAWSLTNPTNNEDYFRKIGEWKRVIDITPKDFSFDYADCYRYQKQLSPYKYFIRNLILFCLCGIDVEAIKKERPLNLWRHALEWTERFGALVDYAYSED